MKVPQLRRIGFQVLRRTAPNDNTLRPAAGATVLAAFLGATVKVPISIADHTEGTVSVCDIGRISVGHTVCVNTSFANPITVVAVDSPNSTVTLANDSGSDLELTVGDRLVIHVPSPTVYLDSTGTLASNGNAATTDIDGRVEVFSAEWRHDFLVLGGDLPSTQLHTSVSAGWTGASESILNVRDFASIYDALNSVPEGGGTLYLPAGDYPLPTTLALPLNKRITLRGEGIEQTRLVSLGLSPNQDMLHITNSHTQILSLSLIGPAVAGAGRGIVIQPSKTVIRRVRVADCDVRATPSFALDIQSGPGDATTILTTIERSRFYDNRQDGAARVGLGCTTAYFVDCTFDIFRGHGVLLDRCAGCVLNRCDIENPADDSGAFVLLSGAKATRIHNCWFETRGPNQTSWFVVLNNGGNSGTSISDCYFERRESTHPRVLLIGSNLGNDHSVVVNNPLVQIDGSPASAAIEIHSAVTFGLAVQGGVLLDFSGGLYPLSINDISHSPAQVSAFGRATLPVLTVAERDLLPVPQLGEVIYVSSLSPPRVQVCVSESPPVWTDV